MQWEGRRVGRIHGSGRGWLNYTLRREGNTRPEKKKDNYEDSVSEY